MALPSARRPPELEEEFSKKEGITTGSEVKHAIRLKVNLVEQFIKYMVKWYNGLGKKAKSELTKKRVIRRGLYFAESAKYPYEKLPQNWLHVLHDEHNIRFKFNSVRKRKRSPDVTEPANFQSKKTKHSKLNGKFIDLTHLPPPKSWMDCYLKDNTMVTRQLKVHKTAEKTIVYYDYEDNLAQKDEKFYTMRHDRDGVFGAILDDMA